MCCIALNFRHSDQSDESYRVYEKAKKGESTKETAGKLSIYQQIKNVLIQNLARRCSCHITRIKMIRFEPKVSLIMVPHGWASRCSIRTTPTAEWSASLEQPCRKVLVISLLLLSSEDNLRKLWSGFLQVKRRSLSLPGLPGIIIVVVRQWVGTR